MLGCEYLCDYHDDNDNDNNDNVLQIQEKAADRRKWESIRRTQIEKATDQVRSKK